MHSTSTVTDLPLRFISKSPSPIKRKAHYKPGFRRLPFVAGWRTHSSSPFWHVPASGGYFGGYETGAAMALAMLKFVRSGESHISCQLPAIMESFMTRFEDEGGAQMLAEGPWSDSFDSFRGQYCGFFNTLAAWLEASAKSLGQKLDRITEQELVARANAGLGFDSQAFMASLSDKE